MPYLTLGPETDREEPDVRTLALVRSDDDALHGQVLRVHSTHLDSPERKPGRLARAREALRGAGLPARHLDAAEEALSQALAEGDEGAVPARFRAAARAAAAERPRAAREITLPPNAHFELLPTPDPAGRDAIFVAGPPGAGKSVWAAAFARKYHGLWPKRQIFLMSKNDCASDPAWSSLISKGWVTLLDPSTLLESPVDVTKDFGSEGALFVADDLLDAYAGNRKLADAVLGLVNDSLDLARKNRLSVLVLNHAATDYRRTRTVLTSCQCAVVFPAFTPTHVLSYFCKKIGIDPRTIPGMRRMGRAVVVSLVAPQWLLGLTDARLVE
jgi:hypothetical protein